MSTSAHVPIRGEADILAARRAARALATRLGFPDVQQIEIATAISEIARNTLTYAGCGNIEITLIEEGRASGLRVVASDRGPGIPDVAAAMTDGFTTGGGLGLGLPGARRLMDAFDVASAPGVGTVITMTKWLRR